MSKEYQPVWRPHPLFKHLPAEVQLMLFRAENTWNEYKSLATMTAEDWDRTRVRGGPNEALEHIALTALALKTMAWMTESMMGAGLIGSAKFIHRKPFKIAALLGGIGSLWLATRDYRDAQKASQILFNDNDS